MAADELSALTTVLEVVTPIVVAVLWIEKRFRDSRTESEKCVEDAMKTEREARTAAINAATAQMQAATARLENQAAALNRQNASLQREMSAMQLQHLRDLSGYPTRAEITQLFEVIGDKIDGFERRFESVMGIRKQGG